ncbi:cytochrome P450, partial [Chytridium lagenaria]
MFSRLLTLPHLVLTRRKPLLSPRLLLILKVLTALLTSTSFSLYIYLYLTTRRSRIKGLPHPPTKGISGNTPDLLKNYDRRHDFISEVAETYGPTWTMTVPNFQGRNYVCTVDPEIVQHVLKTRFDNYVKGDRFHNILSPLLGDGIFNTDGEKWKWQRKVSSHIFTGRNFRDVVAKVFNEDIENLVGYLKTVTETEETIDLHRVFHAFTLDSFAKIALGRDLHCLATPSNPPPFSYSFDASVALLSVRLSNPLWWFTGYFDGSFAKLKHHLSVVEGFAQDCIKEKRKKRAEVDEGDLLDLYMEAGETTDKALRDMVLNMTLAGRDTTAQGLSWAFYVLSSRPDVVKRIRDELEEVLDGRIPTFDEVSQLKYLNAFIMEVMRLYPSDTLPNGIYVPRNTQVNWFPYAMGRTVAIWGSRRKQMAIVEMAMTTAAIVREFEVEVRSGDIKFAAALTLQMKEGLIVK